MLEILCNYAGDQASSFSMRSGAVASGYAINDLISGPRYKFFRSDASSSTVEPAYNFAADLTCDRCVVVHADYLLTETGSSYQLTNKSSGGTWSTIGSPTAVSKANLVGPYSQDLVVSFTASQLRGYGFQTTPTSGTTARSFSKLYFATAFNFGKNPDKNAPPSFAILQGGDRESRAVKGEVPYQCEREISIQFTNITRAKLSAFLALPRIFEWPFFLYDSSGDIWDYNLEHVILTDYFYTVKPKQLHDLTLVVRRLVHDDFQIN